MSPAPRTNDSTVDQYIAEFQRRYPQFERARKREGGGLKQDFVSRLFTETILVGDKPTYDAMLQGMLTEEEHNRLETEPRFTKAWRIFVDFCWLKRQLRRWAMLIIGLLLIIVFFVVLFLALPQLIGPGD